MQNDDEQAKFLREFAKIKDIEGEIKRIHSNHKRLSSRIRQIEIQGFQEQLNSLNDALLETQRVLARLSIHYASVNLHDLVRRQKPELAHQVFVQLAANASSARAQAKISKEPLLTSSQFSEKCKEHQKKLGIKAIGI